MRWASRAFRARVPPVRRSANGRARMLTPNTLFRISESAGLVPLTQRQTLREVIKGVRSGEASLSRQIVNYL